MREIHYQRQNCRGNKRRRLCNLTSNTLAPNPVEKKYFLNYLERKTTPIIPPAATEFHLLGFNARHPNEKLLHLSSLEQLNSSFLIGWKHSPTWLPKDRVMGIKFRDQRFPHNICLNKNVVTVYLPRFSASA